MIHQHMHRSSTLGIAVLGLLLPLFCGGALHAQKPAATRLHGRITDNSSHGGVAGAQVILDANGRFVTSDSAGDYAFADVPHGLIALTVRAPNFAVAHVAIEVSASGDWQRDVGLDSATTTAATRLGAVTVTAPASETNYRLRDFERRRRTGIGQYLTDRQIRSSGAANIQDAVSRMRGVLLDCGGTMFAGCRIRMANAPARCLPEYIVDGQVDNDFGPVTPIRDVIAIEVYTGPTDVPGEFAGSNSGCGVVVLWTRSGPGRHRTRGDSGGRLR